MAVAGDVPNKYDLVLNGQGYLFDSTFDPSVYFKSQKASYGYTPTFIERQNTSGAYGDEQQAFWMTASQNNWSGGDGQAFFKSSDKESVQQFWESCGLDISIPGQVTCGPSEGTVSAPPDAATISALVSSHYGSLAATDTNLYRHNGGVYISLGAHGAGAVVRHGVCEDVNDDTTSSIYVAGATKIRKLNSGAGTWSDFSATVVSGTHAGIFVLNNALYGWDDSSLYTWSTAGVRSTLFTWKDASGNNAKNVIRAVPWGAKVAILIGYDSNIGTSAVDLSGQSLQVWVYDGNVTTMVWKLPPGLAVNADICESFGLLYVSTSTTGTRRTSAGATTIGAYSIVYFFDGHTEGVVWKSRNMTSATPTQVSICGHQTGVYVWDCSPSDDGNNQVYSIDAATGGSCSVVSSSVVAANAPTWICIGGATQQMVISYATLGVAAIHYFAPGSSASVSSRLYTSRFDFDSSVKKIFHGVKLDIDVPFQTTVAIYYSVDQGAWTLLQATAVTDTEYTLSNVTGRSIQLQLRLTSTSGGSSPLVRRTYVRAAPLQETFRNGSFILNLSGNKNNPTSASLLKLRDGTTHSKDGNEMAADLVTAVTAGTPISITDRFGTYTGVIEPSGFELHEMKTGWGRAEYRALVTVRQV